MDDNSSNNWPLRRICTNKMTASRILETWVICKHKLSYQLQIKKLIVMTINNLGRQWTIKRSTSISTKKIKDTIRYVLITSLFYHQKMPKRATNTQNPESFAGNNLLFGLPKKNSKTSTTEFGGVSPRGAQTPLNTTHFRGVHTLSGGLYKNV